MRRDLTGEKFGNWTVIAAGVRSIYGWRWQCVCTCGTARIIQQSNLLTGHTRSCGCLYRGRLVTHGQSRTKIYKIWNSMRQRCDNPNVKGYKDYGGRGITVCAQWAVFEAFYADMGEPPAGMSLERVDNGMGYSKENCVWATRAEQARNSRRTRLLTYQGLTMCAKDWADRLGIKYVTLMGRLRKGWSVEAALGTPVQAYWRGKPVRPYRNELLL